MEIEQLVKIIRILEEKEESSTDVEMNISTAKILAAAQNGTIEITSEPNAGVRATLQMKVVLQDGDGKNDRAHFIPLQKSFAI